MLMVSRSIAPSEAQPRQGLSKCWHGQRLADRPRSAPSRDHAATGPNRPRKAHEQVPKQSYRPDQKGEPHPKAHREVTSLGLFFQVRMKGWSLDGQSIRNGWLAGHAFQFRVQRGVRRASL